MNYNGLSHMKTRLDNSGGVAQQDRMIAHKRKTLDKAISYSYQGAKVRLIDDETICPALINPNQVKQDYDDKILSIGFEHSRFKPGAVFEWINTNTKWLIYLQDLTELAYFKGDIRKCTYEISWEDEDGNIHTTYAALRGPKETSLNSVISSNNSIDLPNYTLYFMIPRTEETIKYFTRYAEFYLRDAQAPDNRICWRIEATDSISMPGIIEINATEHYANEIEDDIEAGIVGGKIEPIVPAASVINGEGIIKPRLAYTYTYPIEEEQYNWVIPSGLPIKWEADNNTLVLTWRANYSGAFSINCNGVEKEIKVNSLF